MIQKRHALPVELIRKVFLLASHDVSSIPTFLLVCRTVHGWLLPLLYHSVKFTTSAQISKFLSTHDIADSPLESPLPFVRNIYIGETPSEHGDLSYASTNWPLTTLSRILWLSTSLKRLTIVNLDQDKWRNFDHVIPSSLEYLTIGPVHGSFIPQNLKQRPALTHFTSVSTYLRDDQIQDIVCFPSIRIFRRILDAATMAPQWAIEQVGCVSKSRSLEKLEIVLFGRQEYTTIASELMQSQLKNVTQDPRVIIEQDKRGWKAIVYDEYENCRLEFVVHTLF